MALTQCAECKTEISTSATTCPKCGKKQKTSLTLRIILCFIIASIATHFYVKPKAIAITEQATQQPSQTQTTPTLTKEQRAKIIASATSQLAKNHDKVENQTFYKSNIYSDKSTGITIYFGLKENGKPWLRSLIVYSGDNWLSMTGMKLVADGNTLIDQNVNYYQVKRDHANGRVWEWLDQQVDSKSIATLQYAVKAKDATLRLTGDKYKKDHVLTPAEKKAIKQVLDAYTALNKNL